MDTRRRSSSRRRALADCTNTISAASRRKLSPTKSTAPPPKPSNSLNPKPLTSNNSSLKTTTTSTGSNNSPIVVDSALSIPCPSSNHLNLPPNTTTIPSDSVRRDQKSRKDEKTWKDKGNTSLETPIIQASKPVVRQAPLKSSSTASGNCVLSQKTALQNQNGNIVTESLVKTTKRPSLHVPLKSSLTSSGDHHLTDPPVQNKKLKSAKINDNGKMVSVIPVPETAALTRPHVPVESPPAASSESHLSGLPAVQDQQLDAQKRKDKGKAVLELPIIEINPFIPHISQASSSAASDSRWRSGSSAVQDHNLEAQTSKDKRKIALGTLNIETTDLFRPHMSRASSSADFGNCHVARPSAIQNEKLDARKMMDKRKSAAETQNLETADPWILQGPPTSSISDSGSQSLLKTPMVKYQKTDAAKSNDKRKMVQDTLDIEATEPSTPQASLASQFSTGYSQRRAPQRRKHAGGKNKYSSCSDKRAKKIGMEPGDDHGKKKSGSRTDPTHKKSRKEQDEVHQMPEEEIKKLQDYYKQIDEFELDVEVVSDAD